MVRVVLIVLILSLASPVFADRPDLQKNPLSIPTGTEFVAWRNKMLSWGLTPAQVGFIISSAVGNRPRSQMNADILTQISKLPKQ